MEVLIQWFTSTLGQYISPQAIIFLISMLPILELRGGLIAATLLGIPQAQAIPICVIANIIPIPFILLFIKKIFAWLRPTKFLGPLIRKLESKTMNKSDALEKGEFIGLMLFVGIPLPGTGAWTGALLASLLGIDIRKSSVAILCGLVIATIIMTVFSYGILGQLVR